MFPIQAPIKLNQSGAEVVNLQEALLFILDKQILNFAQAKASGPDRATELHDQTRAEMHENVYGGVTGEVVKVFQEQNGLERTGEVDDATAAALNRLLQEFGLLGNGGWADVLRELEAHRQTLQEINQDTDHLINIDDKLGGLADAPTLWGIKQGTDHLSGIEDKLVGVADAHTLQEIKQGTDHLAGIENKLGGLADTQTLQEIKQGTDHLAGIEAKLVGVADAQTLREVKQGTDHLSGIEVKLNMLADTPTLQEIRQRTDHLPGIEAKLGDLAGAANRQRVVSGQVWRDGQLFKHGLVRAFHKTASAAIRLGENTTDGDGRYTIRYETLPSVDAIDLILIVFDADGKPLHESALISHAKPLEFVNLTFGLQPGELPFVVSGKVLLPDGTPLPNLTVEAFDKDMRSETWLGVATTNNLGEYKIRYSEQLFSGDEQGRADLFVRVSGGAATLPVDSLITYNAPPVTEVEITLGGEYRGPSEYDVLRGEITPLLQGVSLHELTPEDIDFLAGDTGLDPQHITWLAESARRDVEIRQLLEVSIDDPFITVAAFYTWFRLGMPVSLDELLQHYTPALITLLTQGVADNIAPGRLTEYLDKIRELVNKAKAQALLKPAPQAARASLGDLISLLNDQEALSNDAATRFAILQGEIAPDDDLWKKAAAVLSDKQIAGLQSVVALNLIADGDAPIIRMAKESLPGVNVGNLQTPLLRVAAMEPEHWHAVLRQAGAPGDDQALALQARELTRRTADLMPTDFLLVRAARQPETAPLTNHLTDFSRLQAINGQEILGRPFAELNLDGIPAGELAQVEAAFTNLQRLVNFHPGLGLENVLHHSGSDAEKANTVQRHIGLVETVYAHNPERDFLTLDYLPDSEDLKSIHFAELEPSEKGWVLNSFKAYQRVFRTAGNALLAKETLAAGYHSASAIAAVTVEQFARTANLGVLDAYTLYEGAKDRAVDAGLQFMAVYDYLAPAIWGGNHPLATLNPNDNLHNYLRKLQGIEQMFGRQSTCHCEHCNSVLSPAAYFVDLMRFIDKHITSQKFTATRANHPLKLQTRRPDLWTLALTCENTNTLIPSLDIINEILENAIAGEQNPQPGQRASIQRAVYEKLAKANNSFQQPFVLPLRRVDTYLGHFERTRADIARTLGVDAPTYARARIGLSLAEHDLVAPAQPVTTQFLIGLYGSKIAQGVSPTKEIDIQAFLKLTSWTRDELGQLLGTEFVRHTNTITIQSKKASTDSIQNDLEVVKGLDDNVLDRLHRYTRLWRKLGWQINELDQVLYHFRPGTNPELKTTQLEKIAALVDLKARFNSAIEDLCLLIAGFPKKQFGTYRSLFNRLFNLEPFVNQDGLWSADPLAGSPNPTFTHPALSGGNSQPNNRILQRLLAGLQITDQELIELSQGLRLLDAANALALTPDNLALLYRHARLARLLKLSVPQLLQLLKLGRIGGATAPYRVANLEDLQKLLSVFDRIQTSGFSQDDLAFITGEEPLKPELYPRLDDVVMRIAQALRLERAFEFADTLFTQLKDVTEAESKAFIDQNDDPATGAFEFVSASQRWRLKPKFDPSSGALVVPTGTGISLAKARDLLANFHPRGVLPARIGAQLALAAEKVSAIAMLAGDLLTKHDADLCVELQPDQLDAPTPKLKAIVRQLLPMVVLLRSSAWDKDALKFVNDHPAVFALVQPLDPNKLTLETAFKVARYVQLTTVSEPDFTPEKREPDPAAVRYVLENGLAIPSVLTEAAKQARIESIAKALRVPDSRIAALHPHLKFGSDPFEAIAQLAACLELAAYLGVSGETLKMIVPSAPTPATLTNETEYAMLVNAAEGLYGMIRAKYPNEQTFQQSVEAFEDQIRGLKRDGLVEYLIRSAGKDFETPSDLYQYFLIDTQLEGCARTSRVVAANASLQLYVHRILMNLEQDRRAKTDPNYVRVEPGRIPEEWTWRKNYRVWEANRKVFLYPENYIEPELRDDKTPLFKELESNLLQQQINEESVTKSYAAYLKGFEEVARLKIAGAYHDKQWESKTDILHLFGVTPADPPSYYYRTIENAHYGETTVNRRMVYSSWRKIDVQIPVRKVAPVIHLGRLYVFWVGITSLPKNEIKNGESKFVGYKHRLTLNYTTARLDGSWTPPQSIALSGVPIFSDGEGIVTDPLVEPFEQQALDAARAKVLPDIVKILAAAYNMTVPRYDNRPHNEPIEGYTLNGSEWEQIYPQDAGDEGLLITGRNFKLQAQVDLYEKVLKPVPKMAFGYPGRLLFSKIQSGALFLFSAPDTPPIFVGGPYADSSLILERQRLEKLELSGEWPGLVNAVESRLTLVDIAKLNKDDEIALINGSVEDCLIASKGDLFLLQGSVRKAPDYLLKRIGTTLSETIARTLFVSGLDALLDTNFQNKLAEAALPITLLRHIQDASNSGKLDFQGPYGTYYREIFFHIPFLIANHLNSQQRFSAAQRWYHYLFDPTSPEEGDYRVWRYREFRGKLEPGSLRKALTDDAALAAYRQDPFNPHAIARLRLSAYQKAIVMKYIDNLLDWGDSLFAEFTMEAVNEATMLYVMAADILGSRPADVGGCGEGEVQPRTYAEISKSLKGDSEILVELEHFTPVEIQTGNGLKPLGRNIRFGAMGVATYAFNASAGPAVGAGFQSPGGFGRPPSRPLDWQKPTGSYWTTTGGVDLYNLSSYGAGGNSPTVGLTPSSQGGNLPPPRIDTSFGPSLPIRNPLLPPGSLQPADFKLPNVHDFKRTAPWEYQPLQLPNQDMIIPIQPELTVPDAVELAKTSLVFCIPENKELRGYWDRVENRLYKIRNCMDITGARRQLALFAPEIDPRLLVRARAAGLSLEDVLNVTTGSVPPYRFSFLIEKAKQYAATVQSLGAALLSAIEKKDAEDLNRLRAVHEQNLLKLRTRLQDWESEAAEDTLESLKRQRAAVEYRKGYYEGLLQTGLNASENIQVGAKLLAVELLGAEVLLSFLSGGLSLVPQLGAPTAMKYGGHETGGSTIRFANGLQALAEISGVIADSAGLEATFHRREEDWGHQKKLTEKEIASLDKQIEAAAIRLEIARQSQVVHEATIKQAEETFQFYRDKFSSFGLYTWLSTFMHRLYREAFNTAFAAAKMAEHAYRFERQDDAATLLSNTYWEASQAGLLAGERLLLDLQSLERRYLETNYRTLEIEQSFSLMQFAPAALLELRQTGECEFSVPEVFFDLTYPGHYRRRIKAVRLTIPCVTGPYTNIGATLRLTGSSIRLKPESGDPHPVPVRHTSTIATSSAQNDAGVFEFGFRDERYMPFEGAGAISEWALTLPKNFTSFDYQTISDVIVRISYTAEEDGEWRGKVEQKNATMQESIHQFLSKTGLPRLFSLRHEFPTEWSAFVKAKDNSPFTATIRKEYFPYFAQEKSLTITGHDLYGQDVTKHHVVGNQTVWTAATADLGNKNKQAFTITIPPDAAGPTQVLTHTAEQVFLIGHYSLS